ncbi:3-isopropylmalate dehydrogenase [Calditerrivibrio nitroreducens]|uniref:3-isopropylmalate dehydrogenase n=1 Tax=Calditerrivibrio nitroreducens (strain DSM 19672 / NBRC 101217 / Yu37-1) TaxID=768670 RepID=E4TJ23_CALNY|nr:3-isopropylmalate dehydrogenase [Calditerrivibrio nitroreducens]ADR19155.1 3-isopropylmalate dehydrogenase [Calditerrivibrio nitroreducens DSM 19672]
MFKVAVLPGDGIGPEVMAQAMKILKKIEKKYSVKFDCKFSDVGGIAIDNYGEPLPQHTLKLCEESDAILFGSVGGPKWENLPPEKQPERGALLPLRKHFNLFVNIRPVKVYPALKESCSLKDKFIQQGLDIVILRELTGGIYFGQPKYISEDRNYAVDTMKYTVEEIKRIAKVAFETARLRKKIVTSVDKANVLMTSVLWREIVTELWEKDYPDIKLNHMYVDNAAMQLVRNPSQFDVILTENMFGDILSDEAAMLTGSLGMLPSASLNERGFGLYEPIGGTAPDIAGQNIANPTAQILSAALMLRYSFKMDDAARDIENALENLIAKGARTSDIFYGDPGTYKVSTEEFGDELAELI